MPKPLNLNRAITALTPYHIRDHVFVHWRGLPLPPLKEIPKGYRFYFPADPNLLTDLMLEQVNLTSAYLRSAVEQGKLLAIVVSDDGIVAHRTLVQCNTGAVVLEGHPCYFHLKEGQYYIHYCETALQHRGKKLYPIVLNHILHVLNKDKNTSDVWVACRSSNKVSISGILKAGFTYNTSIRIIGVLNGILKYSKEYIDKNYISDSDFMPPHQISNDRCLLFKKNNNYNLPWLKSNWKDFASGREAIVALIRAMRLDCNSTVLMPAFVPEGIIAPFNRLGVKIQFYPVTESLDPCWGPLEELLVSQQPRLAILIHYFGLLKNASKFIDVCHQHGVPALEDLAHVQPNSANSKVGKGDFVLFSLPKLIGTPDGAVLIVKDPKYLHADLEVFFDPRRILCLFINCGRLVANTLSRHVGSPTFWVTFNRVFGRFLNSYRILMWYYLRPNRMSYISKKILKSFPWDETVITRLLHEQLYRNGLNKDAFKPFNPNDNSTHSSMGYPVMVTDRESLAEFLSKQGIHGVWFETKWDHFPDSPVHKPAKMVMKHHFLFPTAYSLSQQDVLNVIKIANRWASQFVYSK